MDEWLDLTILSKEAINLEYAVSGLTGFPRISALQLSTSNSQSQQDRDTKSFDLNSSLFGDNKIFHLSWNS